MELIGEKIVRLQDSNLKIDGTSTSNETSIFLNRELQEKLNLEDNTLNKFVIHKNDLYKLLCFTFSFKGKLYNRTNLVNRNSNWFDALKAQIDNHFGKEGLVTFEFNVVVQSNNRVYFNSVRQGGRQGLNIRDLFVQNHTKLLFYKNPINGNLHIKFDYSNEEFIENDEELLEQIKIKPNQIFYGAPGTGKSHKIETEILKGIPQRQQERITFHPDYDNAAFVGSYMPMSDEADNIRYKFVPQVFTNIYVKAWKNLDKPYFLVIEEINRGNCAEIFGDIFQLLDRTSNYAITPKTALQKHLIEVLGEESDGIKNGKMILPPNLQLLATMNTSDQSLFPMDSAFKRRWTWKYVPIDYNKNEAENKSASFYVNLGDNRSFSWLDFIEKVNLDYIKINENLGEDKCIGNYFIKPNDTEISLEEFINKVIFYLWNDVFKDEDETPFEDGKSYSDFFPEDSNGKGLVELMLIKLKVSMNLIESVEA
jgi:hypothetical protein